MAADGIKVRILKQHNPVVPNPLDPSADPKGERLHDYPAGEVLVLSASVANALIEKGWATDKWWLPIEL